VSNEHRSYGEKEHAREKAGADGYDVLSGLFPSLREAALLSGKVLSVYRPGCRGADRNSIWLVTVPTCTTDLGSVKYCCCLNWL
jgi:hypothetical protein